MFSKRLKVTADADYKYMFILQMEYIKTPAISCLHVSNRQTSEQPIVFRLPLLPAQQQHLKRCRGLRVPSPGHGETSQPENCSRKEREVLEVQLRQ